MASSSLAVLLVAVATVHVALAAGIYYPQSKHPHVLISQVQYSTKYTGATGTFFNDRKSIIFMQRFAVLIWMFLDMAE